MNKKVDNYYIGFDIGTDSIGWAVTDRNYNILKFNGKAMWGIRLFDEAKTAAERRNFRTARRRLQRRKWRIGLLQEIFDKEISAVDGAFFQRLKESYLDREDRDRKGVSWTRTLFNDKGFNDKNYYKKYPTIYHLRRELMLSSEKNDVRLLYLALHHIIKYRGHFLLDGDISSVRSFDNVFSSLEESLKNRFDVYLPDNAKDEAEKILKDRSLGKRDKKSAIRKIFSPDKNDKFLIEVADMISGYAVKIREIAEIDGEYKIDFSSSDYEQQRIEADDLGEDACDVIDRAKAVYDWSLLTKILGGNDSLSEAKVKVYEKHRDDLALLKKTVKKYLPGEYKEVFASKTGEYVKYAGHKNSENRVKDEMFYSYLKKLIEKCPKDSSEAKGILKEIEKGEFLPLQTNTDNSVIPHQVHLHELRAILDKAEKYMPFLSEKDESGISARDKIEKIFKFRIPYYVGPLNDSHKKTGGIAWIVRKEAGAVTPYNFHDKVDVEKSAEYFITTMTSKCSYLAGENVLPKNSLLYQDFMVLDELNSIRIKNNEPIPVQVKMKIFEELFSEKNKVSRQTFVNFLKKEGYEATLEDIDEIKSSRSSYIYFKNEIFKDENKLKEYPVKQAVEEIIKWATIYGDEKKFLKRKIEANYKELFSEEQIKRICGFKCSGWGRLSKKLLTEIEGMDKESGEVFSVISALKNTGDNLMQLLSSRYTFMEKIEKHNLEVQNSVTDITYENLLQDAYIAPSVKRAAWQTITVSKEIKNILGKEPEKIFIEMARGDKYAKKGDAGRTKSRKEVLTELYKNIESEYGDLRSALENAEESSLQSRKLYLYYTQLGKCMYSGKRIELRELGNYDMDHIYPRSKTKDDSIDNLVLVTKEENESKGNGMIAESIRSKMRSFWSVLLNKKLISPEKYKRLMRPASFNEEELAGFINRQLVDTRWSTKVVADIFKRIYGETEVVYPKSQTVSDFRKKYGFVKARSVNDYHHAKDAYLSIVAGNVWNAKFTKNSLKWLRSNKNADYDLNGVFDKDVNGKNGAVWKTGNSGGQATIETVKKFMNKNNILYTRYAVKNKGGLFNQQIVNENQSVPIKDNKALKIDLKYGGYKGITPAYFALVVSEGEKGSEKRTIEAVPLYLKDRFEKKPDEFLEFCKEKYGLKNPSVKIKCIKKDALFKINGFYMHLRGRSGNQLIMQSAVQLCIDKNLSEYVGKIEKFMEKRKEDKTLKANEKYDGLSCENNENLFQALVDKSKNNIYMNRPANQTDTLNKGFDEFKDMSVEEQCEVLVEVLKLFACKSVTANLKKIDGGKTVGGIKISKDVSDCDCALLINQSPTGLFENVVDLLKI